MAIGHSRNRSVLMTYLKYCCWYCRMHAKFLLPSSPTTLLWLILIHFFALVLNFFLSLIPHFLDCRQCIHFWLQCWVVYFIISTPHFDLSIHFACCFIFPAWFAHQSPLKSECTSLTFLGLLVRVYCTNSIDRSFPCWRVFLLFPNCTYQLWHCLWIDITFWSWFIRTTRSVSLRQVFYQSFRC